MRRYGIRQYVQWLTLVPILIVTVCLTVFFLRNNFSEIDRSVMERGKLIASQLQSSSEYGVASNNLPFLLQIAQGVLLQEDVRGVAIMNHESRLLVESGSFSGLMKDSLPGIRQAIAGNLPPAIRYGNGSLLIFEPILPVAVPLNEFEPAPAVKAIGAVVIEINLARIQQLKTTMLWYAIAVSAAFLALAGFAASVASRRITRPIRLLSNSIRAIAGGDLGTRTGQQPRILELDELSTSINKMAQQLQESQSLLEYRIEAATLELRRKFAEVEQAHQELRESEDRYRTLYTSTPVMLHSIDQNGVIVSVSDYWLSHMGYRREEVVGKKSTNFLTGESRRHAIEKVLPEFMVTGVCTDVYYQFEKKDGSVMDALLSATAEKDSDGRVVRSLAVVQDITERKQAQEALVAAKLQAERANQAKSKFLAAASHDLRQPVHALGLFLGVLARTELSAQQRELLTNALAASDASRKMLDTLLDFSRIEAGVIKPQVQPFRLQPLLNKLENELAMQADTKGIIYRTRETNLAVQSDPALVELILRNLVTNAIRYTGRGGVLVASRRRGNQAVLEVWDTGIGIPPDQQQEVFREFHQLGNPEQDISKGLGLGLAIAQGLANTLGHQLSLASTPGRGSVFRLTMPAVTAPPPNRQRSPVQRNRKLINASVLVIDDDKAVLAGMRHLIRDWGCRCDIAETIEEALKLAHAHAPDVIISDYRLRESCSGVDAIFALRASLGKNLPALLVTGDTAPERLREAQASGIPLLHKPLSPGQLYLGLAGVLESGE